MEEEKAKKIFEDLDTNKDGVIDLEELEKGLGEKQTRERLAKVLSELDSNSDGQVDFKEFHQFVNKKYSHLRSVFDSIDVNHDGKLDKSEVRDSLQQIYKTHISDKAINSMMKHLDKDNDGSLSFEEWFDYLLYLPISSDTGDSLQNIFDSWKEEAVVDFGDSISVQASSGTSAFRNLFAGGVAGAVSRSATAPLDRLKTLIQLQTKGTSVGVGEGLQKIYKEGGILAFFRGNFANCLKIVPESATKFYAFEQLKKVLAGVRGELGAPEKFVAGSLAGVISQVLVYPLDSIKVRMAGSATKMSLAQAFKQASQNYAIGGISTFYRGLPASVLGVIPYAGIDLAIYETLKTEYTNYQIRNASETEKKQKPSRPSVLVPLVCGTFSSTVAQFASTRLQAQGLPNSEKYTGMVDVFTRTVKTEGFRGLYKGMGPNLLKVVPAVGISYVVYESVKNID